MQGTLRTAALTLALLASGCSGGATSGSGPRVQATPTGSAAPSPTPPGGPAATPTPAPTVTPGTGSSRAFPDTTNGIFVFSDQIDTSSASEAQVAFAASHYAGAQKLLPAVAAHLRTYNSNFIVLHYRLGLALGYRAPASGCSPTGGYLQIIDGAWVQEWPGDSSVNPSWFYQYGGASRVYNCAWGWYVMELNDPGWRAWWSGKVIEQLTANQDDGVFADSYSIPNYLGPYNPALPAVDSAFESSWATRMHSFTDYMRSQFAGRWLWIPNVGSWITTRDPSDYSNVDGAMIEGFAEGGSANYYALGDWQLQMNRALSLIGAGKIVIAQTYPNGSDVEERLFDLGTYLLVKGSRTYVNLDSYGLAIQWQPEYGIDLGAPLDPVPAAIATLFDPSWNAYVRHFAKGMVLVNPGATDSGALALGATYYEAAPSNGGPVPSSGSPPGAVTYAPVTSVDLCAHCAAILLNAAP